ncbi:MAG: arginine--tRNA ligase [Candidatus Levybacteria bacterium]|nr:arginine--tRNA ligase [Candidatus Levybacteria bacterium]
MEVRGELIKEIQKITAELSDKSVEIKVDVPTDLTKGDFSTNIAMRLGGNPIEIAEKIKQALEKSEIAAKFNKIEIAKPGFINFYLFDSEIINQSLSLFAKNKTKSGDELILEFGDLNPFKEPHLGHVRNLVLGESLARLKESEGNDVIRANYEGDVGMHVAKCIWGIINSKDFDEFKNRSLEERAKYLGRCYSSGAKAFEEDENAKKEITDINIKIYQKDSQVIEIWEKGREWSLEYFEELYKILGVKYKKYYFESETAPVGKMIVEENVGKVFKTDDGAIIFRGEDHGLHTRVFVTKEKNVTYEGKDLALAVMKNEDFPNAKSIIMTANEQTEYFKVLLKALGLTDEKIATKTSHLSYGFINLKEGKMSSRTGNIVSAFWLIEEVSKRLKEGFREVPAEVLEGLTVASVKWAMLKFSRESNISFSIDESIQIEGNSGPYMLYAYARTQSLLEKASNADFEAKLREKIQPELVALLRIVCQFEIVINESSRNFSPNILTNYLYILAQNFNQFYEKEKVVGSANEDEKMAVINIVGKTLKNGLYLLGIEAPKKI